jgi:predicted Kef-type K+ transport protein
MLQALFLMWLVIEDHDNLFVMAEVVHFLGIGLLAYKLTKKKNAGGARRAGVLPAEVATRRPVAEAAIPLQQRLVVQGHRQC